MNKGFSISFILWSGFTLANLLCFLGMIVLNNIFRGLFCNVFLDVIINSPKTVLYIGGDFIISRIYKKDVIEASHSCEVVAIVF